MNAEVEKNIEIVRKTYEAVQGGGNLDAFFADFSDDIVLHEPPSLPYGGEYAGRKMIEFGLAAIMGSFDNFAMQVHNFMGGGEYVAVHASITGQGKITKKTFAMPYIELWRLQNGKITEIKLFYYDTARILECYGDERISAP